MKSILEAIDPDVTLVVSSHLVDELERVAAVSYTHLDVYKRQIQL